MPRITVTAKSLIPTETKVKKASSFRYPVDLSGMEPYSSFVLYLDDSAVIFNNLDYQGKYSGQFVFPHDMPINEIHFLVALDSNKNIAFNMTCRERPILGDLDDDGDVDLHDFAAFQNSYARCTDQTNPNCEHIGGGFLDEDLNQDEYVDINDMAAMAQNWLTGAAP